jgi:hypothetical protein
VFDSARARAATPKSTSIIASSAPSKTAMSPAAQRLVRAMTPQRSRSRFEGCVCFVMLNVVFVYFGFPLFRFAAHRRRRLAIRCALRIGQRRHRRRRRRHRLPLRLTESVRLRCFARLTIKLILRSNATITCNANYKSKRCSLVLTLQYIDLIESITDSELMQRPFERIPLRPKGVKSLHRRLRRQQQRTQRTLRTTNR